MSSTFLELVGAIYDVIIYPEKMEEILDLVTNTVGINSIAYLHMDQVHSELNLAKLSRALSCHFETYIQNGFFDIESSIFPYIPKVIKPHELCVETEMRNRITTEFGVRESRITEVENWLATQFGIEKRFIGVLNVYPGYWDQLTLHLDHDNQENSEYILTQFSQLIPHIAKATYINRPFELLRKRYNAVLEVLDKFRLGVFIISEKNSLVLSNHSGEMILNERDGWHLDRFAHPSPMNQEDAKEMLKIQSLMRSGQRKTSSLIVQKRSLRTPYVCEISIMNSADFGSKQRFYLVIVMDPDKHELVDISGLQKVFNLSTAESEVIRYLIQGDSNHVIAERRNVSIETVKSQIKSIMLKIGCGSRLDLVRKAHQVCLPVDAVQQDKLNQPPIRE